MASVELREMLLLAPGSHLKDDVVISYMANSLFDLSGWRFSTAGQDGRSWGASLFDDVCA